MSEQNGETTAIEPRFAGTTEGASQGSPLAGDVLRILRRRWWWVALLSAVLAPPAAYLGWTTGKRQYMSTGAVQVKPVLPRVLFATEDKGVMPMYESFVATQMELLRSRRVVNMAVQDPRWQRAYGPPTDEAVVGFINSIQTNRRGEIITVGVVHEDPDVAMAGATSLIAAYKRIYGDTAGQVDERVRQTLLDLERQLNAQAASVRSRISVIAQDYGTEDLSFYHEAKLKLVAELESELQRLRAGLSATKGEPVPEEAGPREVTPRMAAAVDGRLASLIDRLDELQSRDAVMATSMGENNPARVRLRSEIEQVQQRVQERFEEVKASGVLDRTGVTVSAKSPEERIAQLQESIRAAREDMLALGRVSLQLADLRREEARIRADLEQVRNRLEQLRVESATAGRLDIVSEGDRPVVPLRDTYVRNAAVGAFGAVSFSLALVVGLGLLDRRVRGLEDVQGRPLGGGGSSAPMLGVLPEIPEGLEDPELAARAAHNVHHVRTMLELWSDGRSPLSLTVTSPSSGSGKTSLTLALGVSFAAAGLRTLMVDMDLVGGGLSMRVDGMTRRKLGSMLVATGLLTDVQRMEALKLATKQGVKLGEACVKLGYVTKEQIDAVLRQQEADSALQGTGVMEALSGQPVEECVRPTEVPGLFAMTLGGARMEHAGAISPGMVKRMLQRVGEGFDVVLVDTGPTPGSLEAGACATATDGVVLTVARGEDRDAVRHCVDHLVRIGASVAGVVFNRATSREVLRLSASRTSSWVGASASRSLPRVPVDRGPREPSEAVEAKEGDVPVSSPVLGPVAGAVASSVRVTKKGGES
ncbi:MAG: hypothetical protein ACK4PI_08135 [Tepidisphaerales bacterium]